MRHAVGAQRVEFGQAKLQRVKAEEVDDDAIELSLFPRQQVLPGGVSSQTASSSVRLGSVMHTYEAVAAGAPGSCSQRVPIIAAPCR